MIELICGPMSSGKSTEMLRRLKRAQIAGIPTILIKPSTDDRTVGTISTHDKIQVPCITVAPYERDIQKFIGNAQVIGIDEIQFFDRCVVPYIVDMSVQGRRFVVAGLDLDFAGHGFETTKDLFPFAEEVRKLSAVCVRCGADAPRSFRKVREGSTVLVGGLDTYEARCVKCWQEGTK